MHKALMTLVSAAALLCALPAQSQATADNPLLAPWTGPHGGLPPFDKVRIEDFQPALEAAMAQRRLENAAIAGNRSAPTFVNTIVALERSRRVLDRVEPLYDLWRVSLNTPPFQSVEREMQPKLAAFEDELAHNSKLFKRIDAVYASSAKARLTAEQRRLVWFYYTWFVKQGAKLDAPQKQRVAQINQSLASLVTQFSQNLRADEQGQTLVVAAEADLSGQSRSDIDAASAEAGRRGMSGQWVIANTRSAIMPLLTHSSNRELRERAWRMWTRRGDNGGEHDNNPLVTKILALRAERSKLMGFPSYADWKLTDTMARDPRKALDLMLEVWRPAVERARTDVVDMQKLVDAEKGGFKIEPWDYRYYAEKLRKANHDFDIADIARYLQLDRVRDAMFWAAGRLYGLRFVSVANVPVFHPDVTVYEVLATNGRRIGLWYFDPYARQGKNSGAWMRSYRPQSNHDGPVTAIVSNNTNFTRGKHGEPVTISWDDAVTMFHEFGHALEGLLWNITYPTLSGLATDVGEFPAQLNEHWLTVPAVLALLVDKEGHPMPQSLVDKIKRTRTFNKGLTQTEYVASAIVDMKLHLLAEPVTDPAAFEKTTLAELGMPAEVVPIHRIPHFRHLFSNAFGEYYAAGYYAYLWAAVLEHDAFEAFVEAGDPFDKALAKRLHGTIMSVGNTVDPAQAFRSFRGRDPKVDALLRANGFSNAPAAGAAALQRN